MTDRDLNFESGFDINKVSFNNVNNEFEKKFREVYRNSLYMMSDSRDRLTNARGATALGVLEKMAQRIGDYNNSTNFENSYYELLKEYEPFTET